MRQEENGRKIRGMQSVRFRASGQGVRPPNAVRKVLLNNGIVGALFLAIQSRLLSESCTLLPNLNSNQELQIRGTLGGNDSKLLLEDLTLGRSHP